MNLTIKLASTLLSLRDGRGVLLIPYRDAKKMSAEQIISLFHFDHYPIPRAEGGSDHPSNIMPLLREQHLQKTRLRDIPQIAKNKRLSRRHQEHLERMRTK